MVRQSVTYEFPEWPKKETPDISPSPDEVKKYSPWEQIGAAVLQESSIFSTVDDLVTSFQFADKYTPRATPDNYNPFDDIEGYEDYATSFDSSMSPGEVDYIKFKIDKERHRREVIEQGGWATVAGYLAAGVLDPINLIGVGGAARTSYKVGKSFLEGSLKTARSGLLSSTLSEVALHTSQETRTLGESAANVAGATLLSGVLGGTLQAVGAARRQRILKNVDKDFTVPPEGKDYIGGDKVVITKAELESDTDIIKSLGAAATKHTEAKLKGALGSTALARNPLMRLATSSNGESRRFAQSLGDTGLRYEDEIATDPIHTIIKYYQERSIVNVAESLDDSYVKYANRIKSLPVEERPLLTDSYGLGATDRFLTKEEFGVEVCRSLSRGAKHSLPEVEQAAKAMRAEFDFYRDPAIRLGLLPEHVRDNDSYLHRVWDKAKVEARRDDFRGIVEAWLSRDTELALDPMELREASEQIVGNVLGHPDGRIEYSSMHLTSSTRGALKERVFNIPNHVVEDFIVQNPEHIIKSYVRTMAPDVFLTERFGDSRATGAITRIKESYDNAIRQVTVQDSKFHQRRQALLEQHEMEWREQFPDTMTEGQRRSSNEVYRIEREFIEQSSPEEVVARRKMIEELDRSYAKNRDSYIEKRIDKKIQGLEEGIEKSSARIAERVQAAELKKAGDSKQRASIAKKFENPDYIAKLPQVRKLVSRHEREIQRLKAARDKKDIKVLTSKQQEYLEKLKGRYEQQRENIIKSPSAMQERRQRIEAERAAALARNRLSDPNYHLRETEINLKYDTQLEKLDVVDKDALKKINALVKRREKEINDAMFLIDVVRGTLRQNSGGILDNFMMKPLVQSIKTWNLLTMLGQTTLSSIPDIGALVFVNGFNNTIRDVVAPLVKNSVRLMAGKLSKSQPRGVYLERYNEIKDLRVVNEMILNTRINSLSQISGEYSLSGVDQWNRKVADKFSYWSGITWFNEKVKMMAAYAAQGRILRAALNPDKMTKSTREAMLSYGLDGERLKRIAEQFKQYGKKDGGVYVAGVSGWNDREIADVFSISIRRIIDNTILTPDLEKPGFFSTPLGSILGQFKTYIMAATQRYLIAGLQRRDLDALIGATCMTGLGMFSSMLKDLYAYGEVKERTPSEWITLGVDKSGIAGYLMDVDDVLYRLSGGSFGLDALTSSETARKRQYANSILTSLAPTAGLIESIGHGSAGLMRLATEGRMNSKEVSSLRRIIPFQNSLMFRKAFDVAEDIARQKFGLVPRGGK